jgi:hypothetical protein
MHLVAEGCAKAYSCPASPASHPGYAWAAVILFVLGIVVYGLCVIRRARLTKAQANAARSMTGNNSHGDQKRTLAERTSIYDLLQPHAKNVKAALQMAIGIITVIAVGWRYIDSLGNVDATKVFLDGIGIGLAAAAALELAYTLFTDGPDEALDPLMLGLASTLLLKLAGLTANTDNVASVRVAEKAGFHREGTLRRAGLEADGLHDQAVFSLLDDEL